MDKPRISASAIKLGRKCKRRWWFRYVDGIREPSTPQQEFGIKFHKVLENYLRDGTPIPGDTPEGRLAQIGLPHLPNPGAGFVEHQFKFDLGDFEFIGFIDWLAKLWPEVKDHKTTSDFKWALTEAELVEDPAAILYSAEAFRHHPDEPWIALTWDYYRTKGAAKFKRVATRISQEQCAAGFGELVGEARGLIQLKTKRVEDIDPSPEACFSYGRACPYLDKCPKFTTLQTIRRITQVSPDELLATLRAKQGNGGVAPALPQAVTQAAAPQLPPMQTVAPVPALVQPLAPGALPGQLPMFAPPAPPNTAPAFQFAATVAPPTHTVNATAPVDFSQTAGAAPQITLPVTVGAQPPGFPVQAQGVQLPTPPAPPAAPKRRGRPPKNAAAEAPQAPATPVAPVVQPSGLPAGLQAAPSVSETVTPAAAAQPVYPAGPPVQNQIPDGPAATNAPAMIGALYVNCLPMSGGMTYGLVNASEFFPECHDIVREQAQLPHYKAADFGKGLAYWAISVQHVFEKSGPFTSVYVDARTPEGSDALNTLIGMSANVVRGM